MGRFTSHYLKSRRRALGLSGVLPCVVSILLMAISGLGMGRAGFAQEAAAELATPLKPAGVAKLVVVTDDDFLRSGYESWCAGSIDRGLRQGAGVRDGLSLQVQYVPAGAPLILTNNRPKTGPRRALVFFCDASDRVFAFCVGIPNSKQLLALIEEGDELAIAMALDAFQPQADDETEQTRASMELHRRRAAARTLRHYRPLIESIRSDMPTAMAAERLQQALQSDLGERFLLTVPVDRSRLVAIQQHAEAFRYWCDAMLPCVAGKKIETVWPDLTEVVWGAKPWRVEAEGSPLHQWYSRAIADGAVVLEVTNQTPYLGLSIDNRNQDAIKASKDELSQQPSELETALSGVQHRVIDIAEFASLLNHRQDVAVDAFPGSVLVTQWVLIETDSAKPQMFQREAKNRFLTALKRIQN